MLTDPGFWVLVAFVLLMAFLGRPLWKKLIIFLDARADKIKHDLERASALHEEAKSTLNAAKRLQADAVEQAKEILNHAKTESDRLKAQAMIEIEEHARLEEKLLNERIARAEQQVLQEIRNQSIDLAVDAARKAIMAAIDDQKNKTLIEDAIQGVEKIVQSR